MGGPLEPLLEASAIKPTPFLIGPACLPTWPQPFQRSFQPNAAAPCVIASRKPLLDQGNLDSGSPVSLMFFKANSTGSIPSFSAAWSISVSSANSPDGSPTARRAPLTAVFVVTPTPVRLIFGQLYWTLAALNVSAARNPAKGL